MTIRQDLWTMVQEECPTKVQDELVDFECDLIQKVLDIPGIKDHVKQIMINDQDCNISDLLRETATESLDDVVYHYLFRRVMV